MRRVELERFIFCGACQPVRCGALALDACSSPAGGGNGKVEGSRRGEEGRGGANSDRRHGATLRKREEKHNDLTEHSCSYLL